MMSNSQQKAHMLAYGVLTLAAVFWAGNWIIGRWFAGDIAPFALTLGRWSIAIIALLPFAGLKLWRARNIVAKEWLKLNIIALLSVTIVHAMVYFGLSKTTALNGVLFSSAAPVFVIIISWVWFGLAAKPREIAGVIVSLIGVLIIIIQGSPALLLSLHFGAGDMIIIGSIFVWALYTVLIKQWPSALDAMSFVTIVAIIGWVQLIPIYLVERAILGDPVWSWSLIGGIVYVGIFASALAFTFWNYGVHVIGPARTSLFQHLVPGFAAILAIILLGESLHFYHIAGVALILAGLALANAVRQ